MFPNNIPVQGKGGMVGWLVYWWEVPGDKIQFFKLKQRIANNRITENEKEQYKKEGTSDFLYNKYKLDYKVFLYSMATKKDTLFLLYIFPLNIETILIKLLFSISCKKSVRSFQSATNAPEGFCDWLAEAEPAETETI